MRTKPRIAVLDGLPLNPGDVSWQPLEAVGKLTIYGSTAQDELASHVEGEDIVLTNKVPLLAKDLPLLKSCRLIGVLATGVNVVDLAAMRQAGIAVCNVPNYGAADVAQHALALMLELCRHTALHAASVKAGDWAQKGWCYWLKPPVCLTGKTLGIVGFGAIGQELGKYAACLGMKILAWSRSQTAKTAYEFEYASLDEIFTGADFISLHCPLTQATEKLINAQSIARMKTGAIIINTARGGLVDEEAVASGLCKGKLGGFGADVLDPEPPRLDNLLMQAPNTLITPHIAWATNRARQKIIDIMAANIRAFLAGEAKNLV